MVAQKKIKKQTDGTTHPPRRAIKRENAEKTGGDTKRGNYHATSPSFGGYLFLNSFFFSLLNPAM